MSLFSNVSKYTRMKALLRCPVFIVNSWSEKRIPVNSQITLTDRQVRVYSVAQVLMMMIFKSKRENWTHIPKRAEKWGQNTHLTSLIFVIIDQICLETRDREKELLNIRLNIWPQQQRIAKFPLFEGLWTWTIFPTWYYYFCCYCADVGNKSVNEENEPSEKCPSA